VSAFGAAVDVVDVAGASWDPFGAVVVVVVVVGRRCACADGCVLGAGCCCCVGLLPVVAVAAAAAVRDYRRLSACLAGSAEPVAAAEIGICC